MTFTFFPATFGIFKKSSPLTYIYQISVWCIAFSFLFKREKLKTCKTSFFTLALTICILFCFVYFLIADEYQNT